MLKKISVVVVSIALGTMMFAHQAVAQTSTTDTDTVTKKGKVTTTETTTTTAAPRPVYDEARLKKMSNSKTLCSAGFKAYVSNENKNVCSGKATAPDIAYSCVPSKSSESAFPDTKQGPCLLDSTVHYGDVMITKADYKSGPPLPYGTKAECCFRAATGNPTTSTTQTVTPVKK